MARTGKRLEGWIAIADAVGMSLSWCQKASRPGRHHRLPVRYLSRQPGQERALPILYVEDLAAWLEEAAPSSE